MNGIHPHFHTSLTIAIVIATPFVEDVQVSETGEELVNQRWKKVNLTVTKRVKMTRLKCRWVCRLQTIL